MPLREKIPRCRERQKIDSNYDGTATRDHIEEPWFSSRESGGINAGASDCSIKKPSRGWQSHSVNEADESFTTPHLEAKKLRIQKTVTSAGSAHPEIHTQWLRGLDGIQGYGSLTACRCIVSAGAVPRRATCSRACLHSQERWNR